MVNDRPVVSVVCDEWSTDMDNQAYGRAYGGAWAGDSLIIVVHVVRVL